MSPQPRSASGVRVFALVWVGQFISLVGSGFTAFALGVWVYQRTGSVTEFAMIALAAGVPGLVVSPLAGALVDRWDRRRTMLAADLVAGAATLAIALLLGAGLLRSWQIYLFAGLGSLLQAFQWPAYVAATTLLVPKRHLGRVSGLMQLGQAAANVLAPLPAGLMIATVGISAVVWLDFGTYLFAVATLLAARIPRPVATAAGEASRGSLAREALYGWTFIRRRPGLLGLLIYFAMVNLVVGVVLVLVTPLVLSFATAAVLGTVLTVSNLGLVAGSVVMSVTGGPRRRIRGILGFGLLAGLALAVIGLRPSPTLISIGLAAFLFGAPIINGCSQAIWQTKVPPDVQGRVFAVRRMIAQFTAPIGQLVAGPLADYVFEPAMAEGGRLGPVFGGLVGGTGPGRGIGLLYLSVAALPVLFSIVSYARPRVRNLEDEIPDAID